MVHYLTSNRVIASDQMIRNLSMKIGEVDSGSARLLCAADTAGFLFQIHAEQHYMGRNHKRKASGMDPLKSVLDTMKMMNKGQDDTLI